MNRSVYYIGLDLAADSFTAAIFTTPEKPFRVPVARLSRRRRGLAAAQAVLEQG